MVIKDTVDSATKTLSTAFGGEAAISSISTALSDRWKELHDEKTDTNPALTLTSQRFEEVVARIQVLFQQGPASIERGLDALGDGQQSLFILRWPQPCLISKRTPSPARLRAFAPTSFESRL